MPYFEDEEEYFESVPDRTEFIWGITFIILSAFTGLSFAFPNPLMGLVGMLLVVSAATPVLAFYQSMQLPEPFSWLLPLVVIELVLFGPIVWSINRGRRQRDANMIRHAGVAGMIIVFIQINLLVHAKAFIELFI